MTGDRPIILRYLILCRSHLQAWWFMSCTRVWCRGENLSSAWKLSEEHTTPYFGRASFGDGPHCVILSPIMRRPVFPHKQKMCVCTQPNPVCNFTSSFQSTTQWRTSAALEVTWPWIPDRANHRDLGSQCSVHKPSGGWHARHVDRPGRTKT